MNVSQLQPYAGSQILITGSAGYVGTALTAALATIDCELHLLDIAPTAAWLPDNPKAHITYHSGDVAAAATWQKVLPTIEYVFHLAASEQPYQTTDDITKEYLTNTSSVLQFFAAAEALASKPALIFSSSANLFWGNEDKPVSETDVTQPRSLWSAHKLLAEEYIRIQAQDKDWPAITLRLANLYGIAEGQPFSTTVMLNKVIKLAKETGQLTLFSNYQHYRDFLHVQDAVWGLLLAGIAAATSRGEYYVLGTGEAKTLQEIWQLIADEIQTVTGQSISISIDKERLLRAQEMRHFVADSSAFTKLTGWKPALTLKQGLQQTIQKLS